MDAELVKKRLKKRICETVEEFQKREDITSKFGEPVISYVSVDDVRFDMLFARGLNGHPREIYRPYALKTSITNGIELWLLNYL